MTRILACHVAVDGNTEVVAASLVPGDNLIGRATDSGAS
jgi:hypothetical protein